MVGRTLGDSDHLLKKNEHMNSKRNINIAYIHLIVVPQILVVPVDVDPVNNPVVRRGLYKFLYLV